LAENEPQIYYALLRLVGPKFFFRASGEPKFFFGAWLLKRELSARGYGDACDD
jgi:hypothetical protein